MYARERIHVYDVYDDALVCANNHQKQTHAQRENDAVFFLTRLCWQLWAKDKHTHTHTFTLHLHIHMHGESETEEVEWRAKRFIKYVIYVFQLNI